MSLTVMGFSAPGHTHFEGVLEWPFGFDEAKSGKFGRRV